MSETTRTDKALDGFRRYMEAADNAPTSIYLRLRILGQLRDRNPRLLYITHDELVDFIGDMSLKTETRRARRSAVLNFYRWAHDQGLVSPDPSRRLPKIKPATGVPRPAPEDVVRDAIARADEETRLMLMLAAFAGLRRAEIARVHSDDVQGSALRVFGKGRKVRVVPLVDDLAFELASVSGWAFPSSRKHGQPVTADYVANRCERVLVAPWTLHTFRHRFATVIYDRTHDLRAVQALLGHASIATTERYTRVSGDSLVSAVLAARL